jgi:hypothetical protein
LKAEASQWLTGPEYEALRLRLEHAHAAAEAAVVEARRHRSGSTSGACEAGFCTAPARYGRPSDSHTAPPIVALGC